MALRYPSVHPVEQETKNHWRRLVVLVITALALALAGSCGKSSLPDRSSSTTVLEEPGDGSKGVENRKPSSSSDGPTLVSILDLWEEGDQERLVRQFIELMEGDPPEDRIRVSPLTEEDFKKAGQARLIKLSEDLLDLTHRYRLLTRATLDAGTAALDEDEDQLAARYFDAVERCAQVNRQPPVTKLVDMVAQAIERVAQKAKESLPG